MRLMARGKVEDSYTRGRVRKKVASKGGRTFGMGKGARARVV